MQIEFNPLSDCSSRYCTHSRKWNDSWNTFCFFHSAQTRCTYTVFLPLKSKQYKHCVIYYYVIYFSHKKITHIII